MHVYTQKKSHTYTQKQTESTHSRMHIRIQIHIHKYTHMFAHIHLRPHTNANLHVCIASLVALTYFPPSPHFFFPPVIYRSFVTRFSCQRARQMRGTLWCWRTSSTANQRPTAYTSCSHTRHDRAALAGTCFSTAFRCALFDVVFVFVFFLCMWCKILLYFRWICRVWRSSSTARQMP